MPQPPIEIKKYLETPLPALREQYPPGTGGTGPRNEWPEGTLKGVQVIDEFTQAASKYIDGLPKEPIAPHPAHKYPKFLQAITKVPQTIRSPADLQKCLSDLPLVAISSVLTALEMDPDAKPLPPSQSLDKAGYESDGGEEPEAPSTQVNDTTKAWSWKFNKSPLGSGEFYLTQAGSDEVKMVVRTINSAAFTSADWEEYVVSGPYHYDKRSKASWYWSRTWGACNRLKCRYWVLTDWQRWVFGSFDQELQHGYVSPIESFGVTEPSILQYLFFWAQTALGKSEFVPEKKDVSGLPALFPPNPARRVSVSGRPAEAGLARSASQKVKRANESDIEESDAEE